MWRMKESLQDSGRLSGRVTPGSRCASTPGWDKVPLQGTCRWGSWAAQGMVLCGGARSGRTRRSGLPRRWGWTRWTVVCGWRSSGGTNLSVRPHARGVFALTPTLSHSDTRSVDQTSLCGRGGTRAAGPPDLEYGASTVFPCGGRSRWVVNPGSRTGRRSACDSAIQFGPCRGCQARVLAPRSGCRCAWGRCSGGVRFARPPAIF